VIYLNPRLAIDEYGDFYTNEYRKLVSKYWKRHIVSDMDTEAYGESLVQFLHTYPITFDGLNGLDIGGSSGEVAAILKNRLGLKMTVCDPNRSELAKAKEKGLDVVEGSFEKASIEGNRDIIFICRTVDHLFDPIGSLRRSWDLLAPSGWLFVDMVDWLCVARSEGFVNSFHADHPFNFTHESFRVLLKTVGFKVVCEHISPEELGVNSGRIEHGFLCRKTRPSTKHEEVDTKKLLDEIRIIQARERAEIAKAILEK